jgi:hypothetical protein
MFPIDTHNNGKITKKEGMTLVDVGQILKLRNVKTQEEQSCRVVNVTTNQEGHTEAGVEFLRPAPRSWHIAFPPLDWTPRSEEAKRPTRPSASGRELKVDAIDK